VLDGIEVGCEDITTEDSPVCFCEQCVRTLAFVYTGKPCPQNQQLTGKCTDNGPNPFIAGYRITDALDPTEVLATGEVQQNEDISVNAVGSTGCIPDTLAVTVSVPTGEVTQTFTIDSSCSGRRGLILTEDYGAFESFGYSCGASDVHNCKQTVSYGLKVCNIGSDDQTVYDFSLTTKDTISNNEVFSDLLESVNPEDVMLSPSECFYDTKTYDVNRCQEENYCVDISANATNPITGIPKNCSSADEIKFSWPPLVTSEPTPEPTPAPSPAPSPAPTSTCIIDVELDGCPQYNLSLANNCEGRPQVITFRYNGGPCSQSDNLQTRQKFDCEDSNGGPPSTLGTESYIEAIPTKGGDLYFSGTVKVGEPFTLNQNLNFDKLSADMTITAYTSSDRSTLLQKNDVHLSCSQPLYLFDKFGSNQVIEWIETSGRVVTNRQSDVPTGNIKVQLDVSPDVKPVRLLEMQVITSAQDTPIDYTDQVAGKLLQPGVPLELPGFDIDIDLSTRRRYTFFTTIIGETEDGTNMCNGNSFLECTIGFNLDPTFPTLVPTPRPTVTPFPTGAIATTPCEIASNIGCTVVSPSLPDITCDNLGGGVSATCPANERILTAYLEYDGSAGDSVFVVASCDKSEYFAESVSSGGVIDFNNRASDVCDVLTVEMYQSEDSGFINSADIDVPCPGPWTIGNEILPGLKLAYYVSSSDGGTNFNFNALEATVQIDYIGSNTGNSPLQVTNGSFSSPSGASATTNLPIIAQRSRTVVKSETQIINLSDLAGQTLDFSMNLDAVSANQFALPCQTASSYQISL